MDVKSRILQALVTSAASDRPQVALDLTRQGAAARTLLSMGVDCRRVPTEQQRYGLLVCTMPTLPRVRHLVQTGGSLIVHIKPGQHGELLGMAGQFGLIASARTPSGAWIRLQRNGEGSKIAPRVSVVVTVCDDAGPLAHLLSALEDQPTDPAWEFVVVDRGSSDATADLLERVDGDLRRIRVARDCDPVDAMYAGVRAARGDLCVPIPPGFAPGSGFVSALLRHADHRPPSPKPLLGTVVSPRGRPIPGAIARAFSRSCTPTSPRNLQKWLTRSDGVTVPGFRLQQLEAEALPPSLGCGPQGFDGAAQAQADAVLAQRSQSLEQRW